MVVETKKLPIGAIIILILLTSNKVVMSSSYKDQILWLFYITIGNWDVKTCQSENWPDILFFNSTPITHEQAKDLNNKDRFEDQNLSLDLKNYTLTYIALWVVSKILI